MFYNLKFKKFRKLRKLTQLEVAAMLDKNKKTIQRWESGATLPTISDIYLLADILSIPLEEIADIEKEHQNIKPYFYNKLNNLDKSIIDISSRTETEKQRLFINLQKENEMLKWKLKEEIINKEKYSNVINSIDTLVYTKDTSLKYTFVNNYFLSYFNIPNSSLILGHRNNDIWKTNNRWTELSSLENKIIQDKTEIENIIISIPSAIGSPRIGAVSIKPFFDSNGKIFEIIGSIKDVTADETVKEKFNYMESILNEFDDVIWIAKMKPYAHYIYINKAVENIYNVSVDKFYKNPTFWVNLVCKEDKKFVKEALKSEHDTNITYRLILETGESIRIQHSMLHKTINGEKIKFGILKKMCQC
ncbi:MAG: helix-turn-helix domain-containing protein [bacterium]|nr:helix-turn-helix domain-containing protein [bacterium]